MFHFTSKDCLFHLTTHNPFWWKEEIFYYLLCNGTTPLYSFTCYSIGIKGANNTEHINSSMFIVPLILNGDKCILCIFWNDIPLYPVFFRNTLIKGRLYLFFKCKYSYDTIRTAEGIFTLFYAFFNSCVSLTFTIYTLKAMVSVIYKHGQYDDHHEHH